MSQLLKIKCCSIDLYRYGTRSQAVAPSSTVRTVQYIPTIHYLFNKNYVSKKGDEIEIHGTSTVVQYGTVCIVLCFDSDITISIIDPIYRSVIEICYRVYEIIW